jgi:hypothetical protein
MLSLKRPAILMLAAAALAAAQPALTNIEDTLYRADGSRFTGTMYITWDSFQGGEGSNIATSNLTLPIVNGTLKVRLVPTTTASAGAHYNVRYNSRGINQFTEVWAVAPSSVAMRVRDVRISQGAIVGPPPVLSPVQIPDVVGLQNELAVRPMKGVGFAVGRAAVINQAGQLDAAAGSLGDCVRVDGSSGPCGGGGGGFSGDFADGEVPSGIVNGSNTVFTLAFTPSPSSSLSLFRNGLRMRESSDYQISGNTITFFLASVPLTGDLLTASYRFANPSNPVDSLSPAQVVCSSVGLSTSATAQVLLGSCTLRAGLLGPGDRIDVQFQYSHSGTGVGFTGEVRVGGTSIVVRTGAASEALFTGHGSFGISSSGTQVWNAESWGVALSLAASAGQSAENISQALTVEFRGQMAATTSDSLVLRNFTVIRYPAQTNP